MRWLLLDFWLSGVVRNPRLRAIAAATAGVYFAVFEAYKQDFWLFADYPDWHSNLFLIAAILGAFSIIWQALGDMLESDRRTEYAESLEELLVAVGAIISAKVFRFQRKTENADSITPRGDTFSLITHPVDQIQVILERATEFFVRNGAVTSEQFDITIIRIDPYTGIGGYIASANRQLIHTEPATLLSERSAAATCLETGEPLFIADKAAAIEGNSYFSSNRDKRNQNAGSLYCVPVQIPIASVKEKFLVTFATYGAKICEPGHSQAIEATKFLFDQFAKRLELELTLYAVQEAKKRPKT